jgi:hypothetical protein
MRHKESEREDEAERHEKRELGKENESESEIRRYPQDQLPSHSSGPACSKSGLPSPDAPDAYFTGFSRGNRRCFLRIMEGKEEKNQQKG